MHQNPWTCTEARTYWCAICTFARNSPICSCFFANAARYFPTASTNRAFLALISTISLWCQHHDHSNRNKPMCDSKVRKIFSAHVRHSGAHSVKNLPACGCCHLNQPPQTHLRADMKNRNIKHDDDHQHERWRRPAVSNKTIERYATRWMQYRNGSVIILYAGLVLVSWVWDRHAWLRRLRNNGEMFVSVCLCQ